MKNSFIFKSLLVGIIAWLASATLYFYFVPIMTPSAGAVFYLKPGTSKKVVANELQQAGIIPFNSLFSLYVYAHKNVELKTGEYRFQAGSTNYSIWKQITTGTGLVYRPFTIIPGWTFAQLRQKLAETNGLRHLTKSLSDQQIMDFLGHPQLAAEGQFFPETYYYTKGIQDLVILKRAFDLMQSRLQDAWREKASNLPYQTSYQALIAASLIEKEAKLDSERPIISGVILNRLDKNMLLQIDPTVIYGLGARYNGKIYKKDLLENTVYNTYVHRGLPPTPIAMPSMSSINAALHPVQHDYLYYVSKGNGSHQFSKSLAEHNAAVTVLIKKTNNNIVITIPKLVPTGS